MKIIQKFICEGCGREYIDKKEAQCCEQRHLRPISTEYQYPDESMPQLTYPSEVCLSFSDGRRVFYKAIPF